MKVLVVSDSHGETSKMESLIDNNNDIDMLIHLGDYFRDAEKLSAKYPNLRIEYIYGNSDFMIGDVPAEKTLDIEGKKVFITHGHRYSVKSGYDKLRKKANDIGADLFLFGHTHISTLLNEDKWILLNPGSISESRDFCSESYAIVEFNNGEIIPRLEFI